MFLAYPQPGKLCDCKLCPVWRRKFTQELLSAEAQTAFTGGTSSVDEGGYDGKDEGEQEEHGDWDDYGLETSDDDPLSVADSVTTTDTVRLTSTAVFHRDI